MQIQGVKEIFSLFLPTPKKLLTFFNVINNYPSPTLSIKKIHSIDNRFSCLWLNKY